MGKSSKKSRMFISSQDVFLKCFVNYKGKKDFHRAETGQVSSYTKDQSWLYYHWNKSGFSCLLVWCTEKDVRSLLENDFPNCKPNTLMNHQADQIQGLAIDCWFVLRALGTVLDTGLKGFMFAPFCCWTSHHKSVTQIARMYYLTVLQVSRWWAGLAPLWKSCGLKRDILPGFHLQALGRICFQAQADGWMNWRKLEDWGLWFLAGCQPEAEFCFQGQLSSMWPLQQQHIRLLSQFNLSHTPFCPPLLLLRARVVTLAHLGSPQYSPCFKVSWLVTLIHLQSPCAAVSRLVFD